MMLKSFDLVILLFRSTRFDSRNNKSADRRDEYKNRCNVDHRFTVAAGRRKDSLGVLDVSGIDAVCSGIAYIGTIGEGRSIGRIDFDFNILSIPDLSRRGLCLTIDVGAGSELYSVTV